LGAQFRRDNHYVPRSYLKRWSAGGSKLWVYRVLVAHDRFPRWREASTRSVAYHEHLYTQILASGETDEFERWLDAEFEAPAQEVLSKAISEQRLTPNEWRVLIRFFAAQDLRTPARLIENLERWSGSMESMLQETLKDSVARLEAMSPEELATLPNEPAMQELPPIRVSVQRKTGEEPGFVQGESLLGRGLWIWGNRHLLTKTLPALFQHRWTILHPPENVTWFTSDDPVLKVNVRSPTNYDFGGGWGRKGTNLILPLGPSTFCLPRLAREARAGVLA
jgi:hypothetical protein